MWPHFMQCCSLDLEFPTEVSWERHCIKWGQEDVPLPGCCIFQGLAYSWAMGLCQPLSTDSTSFESTVC